jgi:hypothetical protein
MQITLREGQRDGKANWEVCRDGPYLLPPCVELHDVKVGHLAYGKAEGKVKSLRCDRPCIPTFAKRRRMWATRVLIIYSRRIRLELLPGFCSRL